MKKSQYIISRIEEMSAKKAAVIAGGATGGAYLLKKGLQSVGKAAKRAIEGSTGGGHMEKIKQHYKTAKEIAGKS